MDRQFIIIHFRETCYGINALLAMKDKQPEKYNNVTYVVKPELFARISSSELELLNINMCLCVFCKREYDANVHS